jgi:hypothetical protein
MSFMDMSEPEVEPWADDASWMSDFSSHWADLGSDEGQYMWIFLHASWQQVNTLHMDVICEQLDVIMKAWSPWNTEKIPTVVRCFSFAGSTTEPNI